MMKSAFIKIIPKALSKLSPQRKGPAPEVGEIAAAAVTAAAAIGGLIVTISKKTSQRKS